MQSQHDADLIISLGARPETVKVTGNMKFDQTIAVSLKQDCYLRERLGIKPDEKCLVAGSTHPKEEAIVLEAFSMALQKYPRLRMIIAPRHPQRASEVEVCVRSYGFVPVRVSQAPACKAHKACVFIVDTIGELMSFYALADVVFVGGSLVNHGGQNFLEPAFLGKPVVVGPSLFNFRDIARQFFEQKAAIMVNNARELAETVESLLVDKNKALSMTQRAQALIQSNRGATERNLGYIKDLMRTEYS